MQYPNKLEMGYKIGVTAISDGITDKVDLIRLESGKRHFKELGYPVKETDNVRKSVKGRSSDGFTRARELMQLFEDPEVRVIIAASGGDYLMEMLPHLDFQLLKENPKWLQGFSDITGILFTLTTKLDIATIYANNFGSFGMKNWHSSLYENLKLMEGQDIIQNSYDRFQDGFKQRITGYEEFELEKRVEWKNLYPPQWNTDVELMIQGRALGGCLDVLLNLVGTRFDFTKEYINRYEQDRIVWFLESFDLNSEALTRGLWQLKEAGWFQNAAGFLFGRPAMFRSDSDTNYEEVVKSVLRELNLPIIMDADIGHKPPQFTMINGAITTVRSFGGKGSIIFERR